jgi:CxxC-x17-CxxC domain-containing protein
MEFTNKILHCVDCDSTFVFTADEQVFFHDKQFVHEPKHCKLCRARRSTRSLRVRVETAATCSECGRETIVPFKPTKGLPIMCRCCFQRFVIPRRCEPQSLVDRMTVQEKLSEVESPA